MQQLQQVRCATVNTVGSTPPESGVPPSVVTAKGHTVEDTVTSLSTLVISTAFTSVAEYLTPVSVTQDVCA